MRHRATIHYRRVGATTLDVAIGLIVLIAFVVGVVAFVMVSGNKTDDVKRFAYDVEKYKKVDPKLIGYEPIAKINVEMKEPRAITVGSDNRLYVVGDHKVATFELDGRKVAEFDVDEQPRCVAVGENGLIFVGFKSKVGVFDTKGKKQTVWNVSGERTLLTAIVVGENNLFLADAGNKIVWHYDVAGKLIGSIDGKKDRKKDSPTAFVVPSPYFDLAIGADGLLRVTNPGRHRVDVFTKDGHKAFSWGKPSLAIEGFCGCCNPANIASMSNGFVTVEKGIPRIKVYDVEGKLRSVVADTETLMQSSKSGERSKPHKRIVFDVAVDRQNRVLVLNPISKCVIVFQPKKDSGK